MRTLQSFHIELLEDGFHRAKRQELFFDMPEVIAAEDAGMHGRLVAIFIPDIPAPEHEIIKLCKFDEFAYQG